MKQILKTVTAFFAKFSAPMFLRLSIAAFGCALIFSEAFIGRAEQVATSCDAGIVKEFAVIGIMIPCGQSDFQIGYFLGGILLLVALVMRGK